MWTTLGDGVYVRPFGIKLQQLTDANLTRFGNLVKETSVKMGELNGSLLLHWHQLLEFYAKGLTYTPSPSVVHIWSGCICLTTCINSNMVHNIIAKRV